MWSQLVAGRALWNRPQTQDCSAGWVTKEYLESQELLYVVLFFDLTVVTAGVVGIRHGLAPGQGRFLLIVVC
jgi:hypothetical protein